MKTAKDFIQEVKKYCDFHLEYDKTNNIYKFNTISVEEFDILKFDSEINFLKFNILTFLKNVEKKDVFLSAVCQEIKMNLDWYRDNKVNKFSNFNALEKVIVNTENQSVNGTQKYALDYIRNFNEELSEKEDEIFYYLILQKSVTQNYKNNTDFEKVKLHFIIVKYFESLQNLYNYLLSIADDFNTFGIVDFDPLEVIDNVTRCNSSLGKFETAYLFNILFSNNLFYFNLDDSGENRKLIMQFLNKNFKYKSRHNKLEDIQNVNKEFTLVGLYKDEDTSRKMRNVLTKMQSMINSELDKLDKLDK